MHLFNCYRYTCLCICHLLSFICLVLVSTTVQSQNVIRFTKIEQNKKSKSSLAELSMPGQVLSLDNDILNTNLELDKPLRLHIDDQLSWDLELYEVELLSEDHHVNLITEHGRSTIPIDVKFYKAKDPKNPKFDLRLSISKGNLKGTINSDNEKYHLEKIINASKKSNENYYKLYKEEVDIPPKGHTCSNHDHSPPTNKRIKNKKNLTSCVELDMAIAVDYSYFENYGQDINAVILQTLHVMNMVNADYETAFNSQIKFNIVEHVVSSCQDCDPWNSSSDIFVLSDDFAYWADNGGFNHDHDLGQFWTKRDLKKNQGSSAIGYSFNNGACTSKRYHILEDFATQSWQQRVLASHEIAHNLGATHDNTGSGDIMNSSLIESSSWSAQSINQINSFINSNSCLASCQTNSCQELVDISLNEFSSNLLDVSWTYEDANSSFQVKLLDLNSSSVFYETITTDNFINEIDNFPRCTDFMLTIKSLCTPTSISPASEFLISSNYDDEIEVLNSQPENCSSGLQASHDLKIIIEHQLSATDSIYVMVENESETSFIAGTSPTILVVENIPSDGSVNMVELYSKFEAIPSCVSTISYQAPNHFCDLYYEENFNNCSLPYLWSATTTNQTYFPYPYEWKFVDDKRNISNYGKLNNANSLMTIDGTCMAIFDDDYSSNINYTGVIQLYSPVFDFTEYENIHLDLDYIFHSFEDAKGSSNDSELRIDVWDGANWQNVLVDTDEQCPWDNVWESNCIEHLHVNLDQFNNPQFQIRFLYTDGNTGAWAGMTAIDNIVIVGESPRISGCTDPIAGNYNPAANLDDGSCFNCNNGIQDGSETGIDCGGINCLPCYTPCSIDHLIITELDPDHVPEEADTITISAIIDQPNISIVAGQSVKLISGFRVAEGFSFSTSISPCEE